MKKKKDFLRYAKHCTYGLDIGNKDEMILRPIFIPARGNGKTITSLDEYIDRRIEELMNYKRGKDEQGRN